MIYILYKSAFEKYSINETKLLRYASRRKKKEQIIQLINKAKDSALNNDQCQNIDTKIIANSFKIKWIKQMFKINRKTYKE